MSSWRRRAAFVLAGAVVLAGALGAACSSGKGGGNSGSTPGSTTSYECDSFSIDVDSRFTKAQEVKLPDGHVSQVGFAYRESPSPGEAVASLQIGTAVSTDAAADLETMRAFYERRATESAATSADGGWVYDPPQDAVVGGVAGVKQTAWLFDEPPRQGPPRTRQVDWGFAAGDTQYSISATAPEESWAELEPVCQAMVDSFAVK